MIFVLQPERLQIYAVGDYKPKIAEAKLQLPSAMPKES
jgi:hypothetical protein